MNPAPSPPSDRWRISRSTALLLVPVLITIHNAEEALLMPAALRVLPGHVPAGLARAIPGYPRC
jgi:hypothetical protein